MPLEEGGQVVAHLLEHLEHLPEHRLDESGVGSRRLGHHPPEAVLDTPAQVGELCLDQRLDGDVVLELVGERLHCPFDEGTNGLPLTAPFGHLCHEILVGDRRLPDLDGGRFHFKPPKGQVTLSIIHRNYVLSSVCSASWMHFEQSIGEKLEEMGSATFSSMNFAGRNLSCYTSSIPFG